MENKIKKAANIVKKAKNDLKKILGYEVVLIYRRKDDIVLSSQQMKIIEIVSKKHSVSFDEMRSNARLANIVLARQIAMISLYKLTGLSLEIIGDIFGGRDHTTVLHAIYKEKIDGKLKSGVIEITKIIN